jgi:SAM-dependent methyltransferase
MGLAFTRRLFSRRSLETPALEALPQQPAITPLDGYVDVVSVNEISGWAFNSTQPNQPCLIDITVNDDTIATLKASHYRHDLKKLGFGDGRKGFCFNPVRYLRQGDNHVRVSYTGTDQVLPNGSQDLVKLETFDNTISGNQADLLELSQVRWKADEEEAELTWGSFMTGDSFLDVVAKRHAFAGCQTILEVGPGYGRLLKTLLQRELPFADYVGLELSAARTQRLTQRFPRKGIRFIQADVMADTFDLRADVIFCSSTFEHLFPSMARALQNLKKMSRPGTKLFIDFIAHDDELITERAYFESSTAYIRVYSRAEIERFFADAGFAMLGIETIVLGKDLMGKEVWRALAIAEVK